MGGNLAKYGQPWADILLNTDSHGWTFCQRWTAKGGHFTKDGHKWSDIAAFTIGGQAEDCKLTDTCLETDTNGQVGQKASVFGFRRIDGHVRPLTQPKNALLDMEGQ